MWYLEKPQAYSYVLGNFVPFQSIIINTIKHALKIFRMRFFEGNKVFIPSLNVFYFITDVNHDLYIEDDKSQNFIALRSEL